MYGSNNKKPEREKMSENILTQVEAKALIKMDKILLKPQVEWPPTGGAVEIQIKGGYHERYKHTN